MKYFLHDSNSFNDEKITQLFIEFGYEGLGLFYTILERLALQEKPVLTQVLKHQLNVGKKLNKCWEFMESIELISSNNGETFNKQLLNFSKKYQIKKEKNTKRISQWRKNQALSENVTRNKCVGNTHKVKESKVKEIEERNIIPPPIELIKIYQKERGTSVDVNKFHNFYESKNWMVGKNKMKDWQAAFRTWEPSKTEKIVTPSYQRNEL